MKFENVGACETNGCSNADCDEEMNVTEVERSDFDHNNLQDQARVYVEEIYKKAKESLSKEDKETNKVLLKLPNFLKRFSHSESVSLLQSYTEIMVNR